MTTTEAPTTIPALGPCPSWCEKPAGHDGWYDSPLIGCRTPGMHRQHERNVGETQEVAIIGQEFATAPGVVEPEVQVYLHELDSRPEAVGLVGDIWTAVSLAFPDGLGTCTVHSWCLACEPDTEGYYVAHIRRWMSGVLLEAIEVLLPASGESDRVSVSVPDIRDDFWDLQQGAQIVADLAEAVALGKLSNR